MQSPHKVNSSTNSGAYRARLLKISEGKSIINILMIKKRRHTREPPEVQFRINDDLSGTGKNEKNSENLGDPGEEEVPVIEPWKTACRTS